MKFKLPLSLLFLSLSTLYLSACATGSNDTISLAHTNNKVIPALKVPPNLNLTFETLYPIPKRNYPSDVGQVDITPPQLYT